MFTLAPATRFGYFIYPASLLLWLEVSRLGQRQAVPEDDPVDDGPPGRIRQAISSA
jgi:hypothetical protein